MNKEQLGDAAITVTAYVRNKIAETAQAVQQDVNNKDYVGAAAKAGSQVRAIAASAQTAGTFGFYAGVTVDNSHDTRSSPYKTGQRISIKEGEI